MAKKKIQNIISIDKNILLENDISIGEFYFLKCLYEKTKFTLEEQIVCGKISTIRMQERKYIKIIENNEIVLRKNGREIFEIPHDNFFRFVATFPVKTPDRRYLSPASTEGVAIDKIKKIWDKLFKGDKVRQDKAIEVLEAEVAMRKKEGKLNYMNAIEAWLNQANYEKYEYLLEEENNQTEADNHDLM